MEAITNLSAKERRDIFTEAAADLGISPFFVEKDFWVCWTLKTLFDSAALQNHLTFRGGTSLSKAWHCIERFSEDIDLAISRQFLGIPEEQDPDNAVLTTSEKDRQFSTLRRATRTAMQNTLHPSLETAIHASIGTREDSRIEAGPLATERDPFTLYLYYPQCGFEDNGYNQPRVKIEVSARARREPSQDCIIHPYAAQPLPETIKSTLDFQVQCVTPQLTFWEKACLIHEQLARPETTDQKRAIVALHQSRHLYDLHRLWTHRELSRDLTLPNLFPQVVLHRKTFYNYSWINYDTLKLAQLSITPPDHQLRAWRDDYQKMAAMFFGAPVSFDTILATLHEIQNSFNPG